MTEHFGLLRFYRRAGQGLLVICCVWLLITALLWSANRRLLRNVPLLSPAAQRLAMPDQAYWDNLRNMSTLQTSSDQPNKGVLALGRGLLCLSETGETLWEVVLNGRTRLARNTGQRQLLRSISQSGPGEQCQVAAWSAEGHMLWELNMQLPPDCLARVDDSGLLALSANGQVAYIDAEGQPLAGYSPPVDIALLEQLDNGGSFLQLSGQLQYFTPMFEPGWTFRVPERMLNFATAAGECILCLDMLDELYCLDSAGELLWSAPLPADISANLVQSYGSQPLNAVQDEGRTMIFLSSGHWLLLDEFGQQLWTGNSGTAYYGYMPNPADVFHPGPQGRRCFRVSSDELVCVDAAWRELWRTSCSAAADLVESDDTALLLHDRSTALVAYDWDGRQLWQRSYGWEDGGIQTILRSGGLTTYRTGSGDLYGIDDEGVEQFHIMLDTESEYDLAAGGGHLYVRGVNMSRSSGNWLLNTACEALHLALRQYVDCYDNTGKRLWRARLPDGMSVMRLQHRSDGALAVLAAPDYGFSTFLGDSSEWEFIYQQPGG